MDTSTLLGTCLLIFFGRIIDVTFNTLKMMLTVKEKTLAAACAGFIEVLFWYLIVKNALTAEGPLLLIAVVYAGGYATGTFVGGLVAKKFIGGHLFIDVITSTKDVSIIDGLRNAGYGVTVLDANNYSPEREKFLIILDIDKKDLKKLEALVKELDPKAYIIIRETKQSLGGYYGSHR